MADSFSVPLSSPLSVGRQTETAFSPFTRSYTHIPAHAQAHILFSVTSTSAHARGSDRLSLSYTLALALAHIFTQLGHTNILFSLYLLSNTHRYRYCRKKNHAHIHIHTEAYSRLPSKVASLATGYFLSKNLKRRRTISTIRESQLSNGTSDRACKPLPSADCTGAPCSIPSRAERAWRCRTWTRVRSSPVP